MSSGLAQGVAFIANTINRFFNYPFPGTNIGVGYLFFATLSLPLLIKWLFRLIKGW